MVVFVTIIDRGSQSRSLSSRMLEAGSSPGTAMAVTPNIERKIAARIAAYSSRPSKAGEWVDANGHPPVCFDQYRNANTPKASVPAASPMYSGSDDKYR